MTPKEAAKLIGCSVSHVRHLARTGALFCDIKRGPFGKAGYVYDIPKAEAEKYRDTKQPTGFPRGQKRENKRTAKR